MQEGKQAIKMVKGEGKKRPKGSGAGAGDQELLVSEGHSNRNRGKCEWHKSNSIMSCLRKPPRPARLRHSAPPRAAGAGTGHQGRWCEVGQPTHARGPPAHLTCKLSQANSQDTGYEATCFAPGDKTYLGNKLGGLALPRQVRAADLVGISRWQQEEKHLLAQFGEGRLNAAPARVAAGEERHGQPSSHASPAAHKPSATRTRLHSCPLSLFWLLGCFSRFSLLLYLVIQSVPWM